MCPATLEKAVPMTMSTAPSAISAAATPKARIEVRSELRMSEAVAAVSAIGSASSSSA